MSILCKPYEISVWRDKWISATATSPGHYVEERLITIGSDRMDSQSRALEPKLVRKTNGEVNFSFKMRYSYIDNITGEKTANPFVEYITNETKIKLQYNSEWFDLLVKNIQEDSSNHTYTYSLVDQHVTELSKNGYNVVLDKSLMNNTDTAQKLGEKVLDGTDWTVESEKIVQTAEEALVTLKLPNDLSGYNIYQINDAGVKEGVGLSSSLISNSSAMVNKPVYAFYSCCQKDCKRFQFLYKTNSDFHKSSNRVIDEENCQYYIDNISSWTEAQGGLQIPSGWSTCYPEENNTKSIISSEYRGNRYVYSQLTSFHPGLNRYVNKYECTIPVIEDKAFERNFTEEVWKAYGQEGYIDYWYYISDGSKPTEIFLSGQVIKIPCADLDPIYVLVLEPLVQNETTLKWSFKGITITKLDQCYGYVKTDYVAPNLLYNYITNSDFKGTSGWKGTKYCTEEYADSSYNPTIESLAVRFDDTNQYYISSIQDALSGADIQDYTYTSCLLCGNLGRRWSSSLERYAYMTSIVNSGPYDMRKQFSGFETGEEYIINIEFDYVSKTQNGDIISFTKANYPEASGGDSVPVLQLRIGDYTIDSALGGYKHTKFYTGDGSLSNTNGSRTLFQIRAKHADLTKNSEGYSFSAECAPTGNLSVEDFLDGKFQLFIDFITADKNDYVLIKKLQFYKKIAKGDEGYYTPEDEITLDAISYQNSQKYFVVIDNDTRTEKEITFLPADITVFPLLSEDAEKIGTVNVKESNYFNAIQSIAETFKCWPQIAVGHDDTGCIQEKKIVFKNYVGQENPVGFRYGINNKDIKRSIDSKQIVSKLLVKTNSNEFGTNGFCSIARASSNNLKDSVLYDFSYYINHKLLDANALQSNLYSSTSQGEDEDSASYYSKCEGYYYKIAAINQELTDLSERMNSQTSALNQAIADYTVNKVGYDSASEELVENIDNFYRVAGFNYNNLPNANLILDSDDSKTASGYLVGQYDLDTSAPSADIDIVTPDSGDPFAKLKSDTQYSVLIELKAGTDITQIGFHTKQGNIGLGSWKTVEAGKNQTILHTFTIGDTSAITSRDDARFQIYHKKEDSSNGDASSGTIIYKIMLIRGAKAIAWQPTGKDGAQIVKESPTLSGYLEKISQLTQDKSTFKAKYEKAELTKNNLQIQYDALANQFETWSEYKNSLNKDFYQTYSRFIQEGTWIDESYSDDNLYFLAAQSVLYNSSMPKVSYTINVISLAGIPEFSDLDFKIGDQTFIEDPEFFGTVDNEPYQEKITITETTENLDDPSKNTIKVQNYENQFQDLFQRITATVQQAQYSDGSYQKAAALANADTAHKISFLTDALNAAETVISNAGEQTVVTDSSGITITDGNDPSKALRMVSGAILLKRKNEDGGDEWKTGITSDGISANLITAGQVNTGVVQIMNGSEPTFRWDTHGITAYDFDNSASDTYLNSINTSKGVRFDRFGLYGYSGIDGETWRPTAILGTSSVPTIDEKSTFSLTWKGLKVKSENGATVRIGDNAKVDSADKDLIKITDSSDQPCLRITETGNLLIGGTGSIGQFQMIDNKLKIAMSDIGSMSNLYYGTQEFTGDRWENLSQWEFSGTKTGTDLYASEQKDINNNLKIRRKDAWAGPYQKFYAEKDHLFCCSARVSFITNQSINKVTHDGVYDWWERINMSIRSASHPESAYLDDWIVVRNTEYNELDNNWKRSTEITVYIYYIATNSEYVTFYPARNNNAYNSEAVLYDPNAYMEVSSICVKEFDGNDWKECSASGQVNLDSAGLPVISQEFKDKQNVNISWQNSSSNNYNKGLRAHGQLSESIWEDNTSDKATIQFIAQGIGEEVAQLKLDTEGITGDSINREGKGYQFQLTANDGFKVNSVSGEGTNKKYQNVLKVDSTGLTLDGNIKMTGKITWSASSSPTQVVYARTAISRPANNTKYPDGFSPTSSSTWHTQLDSANDKYSSHTYDGGATWTSPIQFAGEPGEPGEPGTPGESGKGIEETTIRYKKHTNGTTAPSGTWGTSIPSIGDGEFLWTRTQITYTDGTTSTSYAVSSKGGKGDPGEPGTSVTISSILYAKHSSATSPPSSNWQASVPAVSGSQPYLWTKVTYSNGSVAYTCAKNTVTRDELWSFLGDDDGIYEDDNGNIAIRATSIISGALQVGGTKGQPNSEGVRFYADMAGETVKIGGWNINSSRFYKTTNHYDAGLQSDSSSGVNSVSGTGYIRFFAGLPDTEQNTYNANFYVVDNGDMVAKNACLQSLYIGNSWRKLTKLYQNSAGNGIIRLQDYPISSDGQQVYQEIYLTPKGIFRQLRDVGGTILNKGLITWASLVPLNGDLYNVT